MNQFILRLKKNKIALITLIGASVLFIFFQNCGGVNINKPSLQQASVVIDKFAIQSKICSAFQPASAVSKYTVVDFFAINLTVTRYNGDFAADSNLNGIVDSVDTSAITAGRPTVTINSNDTDEDGIPDFIEILKGTDSYRADAHEDGVDNDTVENIKEIQLGTDPAYYDLGEVYIVSSLTKSSENLIDCGLGQDTLDFKIDQIPLAKVEAFTDTVNSGPWNLSHGIDENIIFIGYLTHPTDTAKSQPLFFGKIFKVKFKQQSPVSLVATDFKKM